MPRLNCFLSHNIGDATTGARGNLKDLIVALRAALVTTEEQVELAIGVPFAVEAGKSSFQGAGKEMIPGRN